MIEQGGFVNKYSQNGDWLSKPKPTMIGNGRKVLMEESIKADVAIIKAKRADRKGNL